MRRAHLLGALGAAVALILAGCTAGPVGPPVSTSTVPQDAPQEGGDGDYNLTLRITDEPDGPPIQDAAIIVYWGEFDGDASGSFRVSGSAEGSDGGGRADGVVRIDVRPDTPEPETTVPLRTGPQGTATAHVPTNQVVGIVASAAGHTEEWVPRAVTGDDGGQGTVDFPVYKARVVETIDGTWGPAGASPGMATNSNYAWEPTEVPWGDSTAAREGYVERLASLRMTLNWTNGPTGGGDLAIGVGKTTSEVDFVADADNPDAAPGEQTEQALLEKGAIDEHGWPSAGTLYLGPASQKAFAAPMGLEYTLTAEASFDPFAQPTGQDASSENEAPGPALALLPVLAVTALAVRRELRRD